MNRSSLITAVFALFAGLAGCASPGQHAVQNGDAAQLQQILDQPDHGGEHLDMLMYYAVESDCANCVQILLKPGVGANFNGNRLTGALRIAAEGGHQRIAEILIDAGAEPSAGIA